MKKVLTILIFLVVSILIILGGLYMWYKKQLDTPTSDNGNIVEIEIEQGESVKEISVKLQAAGVIKSSDIFYIYIKLNVIAPKIQAGKFKIPQNLTITEVSDTIQKAAGNDLWITIPEGLRVDEVAEKLDNFFLQEENTKFNKEEFLDMVQNPDSYEFDSELLSFKPEKKTLEGFLYPNTYSIKKDIKSQELIELFITTLENELAEKNLSIEAHNELSAYEVLTLASIIEREAREDEEKYMISDILLKRLQGKLDGIKLLQVDATLLYEERDWSAVVTIALKDKDSKYNTYMYTGLTPTPICNPGVSSIKAAMNPEANEYLFYLHDPEGNIHYAKTNDQHVNNQRCFINKNSDYCL